jgi:hypothetical protein
MLGEICMNTAPVKLICSALLVGLLFSPLAFAASLEREAQQFFSQAIESIFSKCGDSSFTKWYPSGFKSPSYIIVQFEALKTSLRPEPLTAGDAHERIDWKGLAVLRSTARRQYPAGAFTQNKWGEWLKRRRNDPVMVIFKQRGQWRLSVPTPFSSYDLNAFERIDCAEVPS